MTQDILFTSVGVVAKVNNAQAEATAARLVSYLKRLGIHVVVETQTAEVLSEPEATCPLAEIATQVELVIVVGGDGSLLGVARAVAPEGVPVLGVNRGSLGFLADVHPSELEDRVARVLAGEYQEENHFLLEAHIMRGAEKLYTSLALNEVVVHTGVLSRMLLFHLAIDGQPVYSQRSDGVIVTTPTGSTAYALSAGGPIMHPSLDAIAVVPMFPHTLTSRPIVVQGSSRIEITLAEGHARQPQVSCDSQVGFTLQPKDRVMVTKRHNLRLLYSKGHSFYKACRNKLDWASRLDK